jgi:hypothetical protein
LVVLPFVGVGVFVRFRAPSRALVTTGTH